jgi:hypothetical protein
MTEGRTPVDTVVVKVSLSDEEAEFVKAQGRGFLKNVVRRFMDTEGALTAAELDYLRQNGGTHGVIRLAQMVKAAEPEVDPETGELL